VNTHDEMRLLLGCFVLATLDPAERSQLETHLSGCPECRSELASYAGLPGLMSRLSPAEAAGPAPALARPVPALAPPATLLPGVLTAARAERDQERLAARRQQRRWRYGAFGAAGLAAAAAAAAIIAVLPAQSAPSRVLAAAAGVTSTGQVTYTRKPWGTQVRLTLAGLPRTGTFTASTVGRDGAISIAATWSATATGHADVTGATPLAPGALTGLRIITTDGTVLLTAPN